jgi:hypothetical protein
MSCGAVQCDHLLTSAMICGKKVDAHEGRCSLLCFVSWLRMYGET